MFNMFLYMYAYNVCLTMPVEGQTCRKRVIAPRAGCSSSTTESVSSSDLLFVDLSEYLAIAFLLLPRPPIPPASAAGSATDPDGPSSPSADISYQRHSHITPVTSPRSRCNWCCRLERCLSSYAIGEYRNTTVFSAISREASTQSVRRLCQAGHSRSILDASSPPQPRRRRIFYPAVATASTVGS